MITTINEFKKYLLNENVNAVIDIEVYHGTNVDFDTFDLDKTAEGVIWFTNSKESIVNGTTGGDGNKYIITKHITLNNPAGWDEYDKYSIGELIEMKYDGVILSDDGKTDYIVFDLKNIR